MVLLILLVRYHQVEMQMVFSSFSSTLRAQRKRSSVKVHPRARGDGLVGCRGAQVGLAT